MASYCDVCHSELGLFNKFRYADGCICKACYQKASRQFTETITQKSLAEIKALCQVERDIQSYESFRMSGKIGNYLLVDEKDLRLCIPSNRMTGKQVAEPVFVEVSDLASCQLIYHPGIAREELEQLIREQKSEQTVNYLKVVLNMKDGSRKEISLLSNPVRIKSFAFRQSYQFADRICSEVNRLMEKCSTSAAV